MYINKVRIKNYKSFLDSGYIDVDDKLFALIGQNNTGKSTVLDAIQCVFPSTKKNINTIDFHRATENSIEIEILFSGVTDEYLEQVIFKDKIQKQVEKVKMLEHDGNSAKLEKERKKIVEIKEKYLKECLDKYKIDDEKVNVKLVAKKGKTITKQIYVNEDTKITEADLKVLLPQLKVIPAIRDPKNESTAGSNSYLKELIQMLDDEIQTNIEIEGKSISYRELNNVISKEAKERCKSLGNRITDFYNKAIGNAEYEVVINSDVNISKGTTYTTRIKDINTGIENDILNCGTGYQSMVILSMLEAYVDISNNKSQYILLIEEPEVYLHPNLQRKMIDTLISISDNNQVIFTSHSPITLSKLSKQQIKLVKKENGVAFVEDVVPKVVIDELGIKADDVFANKCIIFVEGKDDKNIFEILINKIEDGLTNKINIIDVGNCKQLKFYANAEVLINNRFNIPTLIIRDTDTKKSSVRKDELIMEILSNRSGLLDEDIKEKIIESIRIIDKYSLEGFFIDDKLLSIIDASPIEIEQAIECYECQYNYYTEKAYSGKIPEKTISSYYQPKYFLEKFDDKFKASQVEQIEAYNLRYENQWRGFKKCIGCKENKIDNYFDFRKKVNEYTKSLKLQKKDFMIECIIDKTIDELKETKLKDIIRMLEEFIGKLP
ncbi:AAA family ATPase [Clostridium perfringens]|uniref:ATP-dependent nuclease n=1 Tax=Clostridium perfringens TaxID=1502 RepID=UPI001CAF5DD2|nr:AAA family ATPase [Clostridium perfringens]MDH2340056.1 AAA family ATPase [Clostridium perfringens]MDN4737794.1 AAA family ATPase [Clostridium perfringens]MDN4741090.1 AAA family ATPase [Clostridium perfringens]HBI7022512.1 AAA family ATPase [Clostridium perfringens]